MELKLTISHLVESGRKFIPSYIIIIYSTFYCK